MCIFFKSNAGDVERYQSFCHFHFFAFLFSKVKYRNKQKNFWKALEITGLQFKRKYLAHAST